jgi:hypothetical protein
MMIEKSANMKKLLLKLSPEEIEIFLEEIKDALKRGYSLGYIDGVNNAQGRPQSSSSKQAVEHHIEQIKERYNL